MESLRLAPADSIFPKIPCSRCADHSRGGTGSSAKPIARTASKRWRGERRSPLWKKPIAGVVAICHHLGTVRYVTFPLHSRRPVEMELCSEHLRALIVRRLGPHGFEQLRRQLHNLGIEVAA